MTRAKRSFSSLRKLTKQSPSLDELLLSTRYHISKMDDRGLAIIQAANLENSLQACIVSRWNSERDQNLSEEQIDELFVREGSPIGTFSAKIKVCHAIGIFGNNTRSDMDRICELRNAFAHARKPISFDTQQVITICSQLRAPTLIQRPPKRTYHTELPWPPTDARTQYFYATISLGGALIPIMHPDLSADLTRKLRTPPLN